MSMIGMVYLLLKNLYLKTRHALEILTLKFFYLEHVH